MYIILLLFIRNFSTNMIDYVQPGAFRQLPNIKIM
jgi:hypothetical protein